MKKLYFILPFILIGLCILSCNSDKDNNSKNAATSFDIQKAKTFIDSINTKWVEQLKSGDSATLASHYSPDAKILLSGAEPVSGPGILSLWGSIIRGGMTDWKFITTDFEGNSDYLIETGTYEINDVNKKLADKGNYVVIWKKQPGGDWKLYRDVGVSSMPAAPAK
jgi:ketosteroid isomerase-like protein